MVPMTLERLADDSSGTLSCGQRVFLVDKKGFTAVGGIVQHTATRRAPQPDEHSISPSNLRVNCSAIADGDIARVREAAALILQEEVMYGR